ncbi:MAG TPA: monovalent cation/H(+) antiporter subunit G [Kiritimatiellia bacterium]|nr:monovalent cation/H(+) antiporter subunit G [Kiritimatiellia bacterium]HMO99272.1 monovalent cation/H(+) antiporter subunit G [Kiritimatiellia bacterium]HMP97693.1 monovalent cation/H(+) antiporter subunit G [Kiritimatiellia bacterium]
MSWLDVLSIGLLGLGCLFFLAGTVGMLRFPDVYTRLHALTKADNLGLGLIALALALRAGSPFEAVKLFLVWLLIMFSSSLSAFLVANAAHRNRTPFWRKES